MLYKFMLWASSSNLTEFVQALLHDLEEGDWESLARRRVQHYGYRFRYEA